MWIPDPEVSVEGAGIAAAPAPTRRRRARPGAASAGLGARLRTTPGRLVLISVLVVVGAVVLRDRRHRRRAVARARGASGPDRTPSRCWSTPSTCTQRCRTPTRPSPPDCSQAASSRAPSRARYLRDLRVATSSLTALTRGGDHRRALRPRSERSPISSRSTRGLRRGGAREQPPGLPDRRGLPAPGRMRCMTSTHAPGRRARLPRGGRAPGRRLPDRAPIRRRWSRSSRRIAVALVLLLLAQRYVTRISRRIFNLPMLIATVALVGRLGVGGDRRDQRAERARQRAAQRLRLGRGPVGRQRAALPRAGRPQPRAGQPRHRQTDPLDFAAVKRGPHHQRVSPPASRRAASPPYSRGRRPDPAPRGRAASSSTAIDQLRRAWRRSRNSLSGQLERRRSPPRRPASRTRRATRPRRSAAWAGDPARHRAGRGRCPASASVRGSTSTDEPAAPHPPRTRARRRRRWPAAARARITRCGGHAPRSRPRRRPPGAALDTVPELRRNRPRACARRRPCPRRARCRAAASWRRSSIAATCAPASTPGRSISAT